MPQVSEEQLQAAKNRGAKVTKKLKQGEREKPIEIPAPIVQSDPAISEAVNAMSRALIESNAQAMEQNASVQALITAIENQIKMQGPAGPMQPFRCRVHRNRTTNLIDYVDVIPIERTMN